MNKINFHIDKGYSIKELQEKFSHIYPYLKINFSKMNLMVKNTRLRVQSFPRR